jgi:hypothetical protein
MRRAESIQWSPSPKLASSKHPATEFALPIAGAANSRRANSANYSIKLNRVPQSLRSGFLPDGRSAKAAREGNAGGSRRLHFSAGPSFRNSEAQPPV